MRSLLSLFGAAVVVVTLSGCFPQQHHVAPEPSPTPTPLFATEDEALAAAEDAYAAYERAVDESLTTYEVGGLNEVATGSALSAALESVESFRANGRKQTGSSTVSIILLISEDPVQIYACLDISDTDVVDSDGVSTLMGSRTDRYPTVVTFQFEERLVVESEEVWGGENYC